MASFGPLICVGAVYMDHILTVPFFPQEDKKLRASELKIRRGGNCANTLEVFTQLVAFSAKPFNDYYLLSVLPNKDSGDVQSISSSLVGVKLDPTCIYRSESSQAASSYIIRSQANGSRTIVSYNGLPEMTVEEFISSSDKTVQHMDACLQTKGQTLRGWYHFEGRVPETTLGCVQALRNEPKYQDCKISVELEKPEREGMIEVAKLADVVFYSRIWAEHHGTTSARQFLETQLPLTRPEALLCCTWGSRGATVVQKRQSDSPVWADVEAWKPRRSHSVSPAQSDAVVDTVGAGDTFTAGMLYGLYRHADDWSLHKKLSVANELAGRKVLQEGFGGLGQSFHDENSPTGEIIL